MQPVPVHAYEYDGKSLSLPDKSSCILEFGHLLCSVSLLTSSNMFIKVFTISYFTYSQYITELSFVMQQGDIDFERGIQGSSQN